MRMLAVAAMATIALGLSACGSDSNSDESGSPQVSGSPSGEDVSAGLPQGSEHVELDPADFTTDIDNPYLPFQPGSRWVYRERDLEGTVEKVVVEVTDRKKTVVGIDAVVVRDTVSEDGVPIEVTDDWYAQDTEGNVWYLGEDTSEYKNGKPINNKGSFEAGVDGAEAGIIMPGDPQVGMSYRQEYYEGEAEDQGAVVSLDAKAEAPFGFYPRTLMTSDLVPLEPRVQEYKFYAKGVGLVLAVHTSGGTGREELISFTEG